MIETQGTRSRAPPEQGRALKTQVGANQWSIENEPKEVPVSTSEMDSVTLLLPLILFAGTGSHNSFAPGGRAGGRGQGMGSTQGDNNNAKEFVSFDLALIHELTPEFDSLVMAAESIACK